MITILIIVCFRFNYFTAEIENRDVHFIYEKLDEPDAILLIIYYGCQAHFSNSF